MQDVLGLRLLLSFAVVGACLHVAVLLQECRRLGITCGLFERMQHGVLTIVGLLTSNCCGVGCAGSLACIISIMHSTVCTWAGFAWVGHDGGQQLLLHLLL